MRCNPLRYMAWYVRSRRAAGYARRRGLPGMEFDRFGRQAGWRMLLAGRRAGMSYVLNPVSCVRYFEYAFARSCLPDDARDCADVSSPRLFSLYVEKHEPSRSIRMFNPDAADANLTREMIGVLSLGNISIAQSGVDTLASMRGAFDCIWSISVIEHIAGQYNDTDAARLMYAALKPGGRLILTFPTDRAPGEEYRAQKQYETQAMASDGRYFFQRRYDLEMIRRRVLEPLGAQPQALRWFGETDRGWLAGYMDRWQRTGYECTVNDPAEMADHFREYDSFEQMPGMGVCGMCLCKRDTNSTATRQSDRAQSP